MSQSAEELAEKIALYAQWLTDSCATQQQLLYSVCQNLKQPEGAMRMKYGSLEAMTYARQAFVELIQGSTESFMKNWLKGSDTEGDKVEE